MNKKLSTLVFTLLLFLVCGGMAQATYYHFEDYGQTNVHFDLGDEVTWTFDLNNDSMGLWVIQSNPLNNYGTDWDKTSPYYSVGNMSPADYLHRAYLTMKFNTQDSEGESIDFTIDFTDTITNWLLQQGGIPIKSISTLQSYLIYKMLLAL